MVASFPQAESPASIHLLAIDDTGRTTIRVLWSYRLPGSMKSVVTPTRCSHDRTARPTAALSPRRRGFGGQGAKR